MIASANNRRFDLMPK